MFGTIPQPTPFDLHWRMFGIDVRVHPFFWLVAVMLGWSWSGVGLEYLLMWVLCVFVSVLIHELGHVVMGRVFGSEGHILLYTFGGLAIGSSNLRPRWQRLLVLFAGPGAQFLLFGLVWAAAIYVLPATPGLAGRGHRLLMLEVVAKMLLWINLFWPLLNLLPIFPLDGGQISREICQAVLRERGTIVALGLSLAAAALLAVNTALCAYGHSLIPHWPFDDLYMAVFFGLFAVSSFQLFQAEMNRNRWREERLPWE